MLLSVADRAFKVSLIIGWVQNHPLAPSTGSSIWPLYSDPLAKLRRQKKKKIGPLGAINDVIVVSFLKPPGGNKYINQ